VTLKFLRQIIQSLLISIICVTNVFSQQLVSLSTEAKKITGEFEILILDSDTLSADEVWNSDIGFKKLGTSIIPAYNFGKNKTIWLKTVLINSGDPDVFKILIENNTLDLIEEYRISPEIGVAKLISKIGQNFPYAIREFDHPEYISEFRLESNDKLQLIFKLQNTEEQSVPIWLGSNESILEKINRKNFFNGIFAGIFIVMLLYNLFLYFSTKYKIYAYYSFYVFSIGLGLFTWAGLSFKYLFPQNPWLSQRAFIFFLSLTAISAILFLREFLKVKNKNPKFDKLLLSFIALYCLTIMVLAFSVHWSQQMVNVLSITVIFILVYSINSARKGDKQAKIYLAAWATYFLAIIVFFLREFAIIEHTHFTYYMIHYGTALEVIVLSLALGNRINTLRKEKRDLIKEQNSMLEEKVIARTNELEQQELLMKLIILSTLFPLTYTLLS